MVTMLPRPVHTMNSSLRVHTEAAHMPNIQVVQPQGYEHEIYFNYQYPPTDQSNR